MSTRNIGNYEDLTKVIFQLSSKTHLITSPGLVAGTGQCDKTGQLDNTIKVLKHLTSL